MIEYEIPQSKGLLIRENDTCVCPVETHKVLLKETRKTPTNKIKNPQDVVALLKEMADYDREHFKVIHLDTKNRIVGIDEASIGILDAAVLHPRELLKAAILNNANSVVLIHNHPSGDCTPSSEDKQVSKRMRDAFELLDIKILDNIIIAKECYKSQIRDNWEI